MRLPAAFFLQVAILIGLLEAVVEIYPWRKQPMSNQHYNFA
jgi:hypothetical protein